MSSARAVVENLGLRVAMGLPRPVLRRLLGRPVVVDGRELSPEMQMMLTLLRLMRHDPLGERTLHAARALAHAQGLAGRGRQPIGAVREIAVDGADGPRPARLYVPTSRLGTDRVPTMLYLHGGGMALGDLDSHDGACRHLAEHSGVQVLSFDYRQPPEHVFPAAVEDSFAAYQWLVKSPDVVGADPERLAVGGDSAGGNLAATTAILAAEAGLPMRLQLLVYPITDFVNQSRSREQFGGGGYFLSRTGMDRLSAWYFADPADAGSPLASIALRDGFPPGLAPAHVVTAGFDPLRDEGDAYADLLAAHGVNVTHASYPGMVHTFFNVVSTGRDARRYNREIAARVRDRLA